MQVEKQVRATVRIPVPAGVRMSTYQSTLTDGDELEVTIIATGEDGEKLIEELKANILIGLSPADQGWPVPGDTAQAGLPPDLSDSLE